MLGQINHVNTSVQNSSIHIVFYYFYVHDFTMILLIFVCNVRLCIKNLSLNQIFFFFFFLIILIRFITEGVQSSVLYYL